MSGAHGVTRPTKAQSDVPQVELLKEMAIKNCDEARRLVNENKFPIARVKLQNAIRQIGIMESYNPTEKQPVIEA
jgi:hypothetical protein